MTELHVELDRRRQLSVPEQRRGAKRNRCRQIGGEGQQVLHSYKEVSS